MKVLEWIKNWWMDGDLKGFDYLGEHNYQNGPEIDVVKEIETDHLEDRHPKKEFDHIKGGGFFGKIALLKLTNKRKNEIAQTIVLDSHPGKFYWIQFTLSCMIATLGLLMNSIPVVIGAMLISPLLDPIKAFAFAITTGNRGMYMRSIKTLLLGVLIAIISSVFIALIVPFSNLTTEVMARISPTMVDLFVALFSGTVAFLSLGFRRMEENIAGVAMSVALLPPLSVIGIGVFFLDFSVAQGSFLLFMANLVAILVIGIIIFYIFGFFPTNKEGQKRSVMILVMVLISVLVVSIPLQKSMQKISMNMKIRNQINVTSENYLHSLNDNIILDEISFNNVGADVLRIDSIINVPSDITITNLHKQEFTKMLSMATQKSIELNLNIIETSSVYVGEKTNKEDKLIESISNIIYDSFNGLFLTDHRILKNGDVFVFLDIYKNRVIDEENVYKKLLAEVESIYGEKGNLVIQWQSNSSIFTRSKSQKELEIEKQFSVLFPGSTLNNVSLNSATKNISGYVHDYMYIDIDFVTPFTTLKTKRLLSDWKSVLEKRYGQNIMINSRVEYFSILEL